jgi:hypothetical protein
MKVCTLRTCYFCPDYPLVNSIPFAATRSAANFLSALSSSFALSLARSRPNGRSPNQRRQINELRSRGGGGSGGGGGVGSGDGGRSDGRKSKRKVPLLRRQLRATWSLQQQQLFSKRGGNSSRSITFFFLWKASRIAETTWKMRAWDGGGEGRKQFFMSHDRFEQFGTFYDADADTAIAAGRDRRTTVKDAASEKRFGE